MEDLEEQMEPEQFVPDDSADKPLKEVYKFLKQQKKYEKLNKKQEAKHKATFHRINNANHYTCDKCGENYPEYEGSLIYNNKGEFAYCSKCLKELYPNYRKVHLATRVSKTDLLNNHWETKYNNGLY